MLTSTNKSRDQPVGFGIYLCAGTHHYFLRASPPLSDLVMPTWPFLKIARGLGTSFAQCPHGYPILVGAMLPEHQLFFPF